MHCSLKYWLSFSHLCDKYDTESACVACAYACVASDSQAVVMCVESFFEGEGLAVYSFGVMWKDACLLLL